MYVDEFVHVYFWCQFGYIPIARIQPRCLLRIMIDVVGFPIEIGSDVPTIWQWILAMMCRCMIVLLMVNVLLLLVLVLLVLLLLLDMMVVVVLWLLFWHNFNLKFLHVVDEKMFMIAKKNGGTGC